MKKIPCKKCLKLCGAFHGLDQGFAGRSILRFLQGFLNKIFSQTFITLTMAEISNSYHIYSFFCGMSVNFWLFEMKKLNFFLNCSMKLLICEGGRGVLGLKGCRTTFWIFTIHECLLFQKSVTVYKAAQRDPLRYFQVGSFNYDWSKMLFRDEFIADETKIRSVLDYFIEIRKLSEGDQHYEALTGRASFYFNSTHVTCFSFKKWSIYFN